jgi:hypothetical protein
VIRHWFKQFDEAYDELLSKGPTVVEGQEVPFTVFIAMRLLWLDAGSPYHMNKQPLDGMIEYKVAIALERAKDAAMPFIQFAISVGRPLRDG